MRPFLRFVSRYDLPISLVIVVLLGVGIFCWSEISIRRNQPAPMPQKNLLEKQVPGVSEREAAPSPLKEQTEIIAVSANKLVEEYDQNVFAADKKYNRRWIKVTGKIVDLGAIDSSEKSDLYILLGDQNPLSTKVRCHTENNEKTRDQLAALKKGDSIVIIGECRGKRDQFVIIWESIGVRE